MSDSDLRNLEHQAAAGDLEAAARALAERVRTGDLAESRLRMAAYLSHAPALSATESSPPPTDLPTWCQGLVGWEREALVRVAIAAARVVVPVYQAQQPGDPRVEQLTRAAEDRLLDPSPDTVLCGQFLLSELQERGFYRARYAYAAPAALEAALAERVDARLADDLSWEEASHLCRSLRDLGAEVYLEPAGEDPQARYTLYQRRRADQLVPAIKTLRDLTGMSLSEAHAAARGSGSVLSHTLQAVATAADTFWAEEGLNPAAVMAAIQRELLPWALGQGDPVRARVAERRPPRDGP